MKDLPYYCQGVIPMYGVKQPAPAFDQGCDIIVQVELKYHNESLTDISNWIIETFVKKSLKANNVLWKCDLQKDMFHKKDTGIYWFRIPAKVTSEFIPGSYFFTVIGKQKIGTGEDFDAVVNLMTGMFDLNLNAASPNPKLANSFLVAFKFDPIQQTWIAAVAETEPTEPNEAQGPFSIP